MSYSNDRIEAAKRRALDITFNTTIEVYEPTESYQAGDGFSVTRPKPETDSPDATYESRAMDPSATGERERSGTDTEADRVFEVRDDLGQTWTDFGESGEAAVYVRETGTGIVYVVEVVTDRLDGRERLDCVEV